jgi:hypothetical protein
MPSPFPGMDPYLEEHWGDIHTALITYMRDDLSKQMPGDLRVRVEEYVAVEVDDFEREAGFYPDVRVVERLTAERPQAGIAEMSATAQPHVVPLELEPPTQREIRIIDRKSGDRVVTAIELLSPTNKHRGRQDYRRKQRQFLRSGTNLVEIDLLRDGAWVIAAPYEVVPETCIGPYRICIVRAGQSQCELFEASYRFRLPTVPIPLRAADEDAKLDLQSLLARAYDNGRYGDDVDYGQDPSPPLPSGEAEWMDSWLKEQGRR